jgi:hypothetical protein
MHAFWLQANALLAFACQKAALRVPLSIRDERACASDRATARQKDLGLY